MLMYLEGGPSSAVAWQPQCSMGVKSIRRRLTVRIQHGCRDGLWVGELIFNSEAGGLFQLKADDTLRARVPPWLGVLSPCRSSSRTRSCPWCPCCAATTPREWPAKTTWVSPSCCGLSAGWPRKVRANMISLCCWRRLQNQLHFASLFVRSLNALNVRVNTPCLALAECYQPLALCSFGQLTGTGELFVRNRVLIH